jgi:hypothetical protein
LPAWVQMECCEILNPGQHLSVTFPRSSNPTFLVKPTWTAVVYFAALSVLVWTWGNSRVRILLQLIRSGVLPDGAGPSSVVVCGCRAGGNAPASGASCPQHGMQPFLCILQVRHRGSWLKAHNGRDQVPNRLNSAKKLPFSLLLGQLKWAARLSLALLRGGLGEG